MQFIAQVQATGLGLAALLGACIYAIWRGRPEITLAIYLCLWLWTRTVMVGPIAHTWVLLAATLVAAVVYYHGGRELLVTPQALRRYGGTLLPPRDRWIVPWIMLWWGFIYLLLDLYDPGDKHALLRNFLLTLIVPVAIIWLFAYDVARVRSFAITYVLTALVGCYVALSLTGVPVAYLLEDPSLSNTTILRLNLVSYHHFSHMLTIGMIFAVTLFFRTRNPFGALFWLASAGVLAHFILLAGARQSMAGGLIVLGLMVLWALRRSGSVTARAVLVVAGAILIGITLYQVAPGLIVREDENDYTESFNLFAEGNRVELWAIGYRFFLNSPIWGTGFENAIWSHNLFIGTLADQGLVGMVFFMGFLVFVLRQMRGLLSRGPADERSMWRVAMLCVFAFGMIHGQVSGSTISTAHLYWSAAMLWFLASPASPVVAEQPARFGRPWLRPALRRVIEGRL